MAEFMLRRAVASRDLPWIVESAGTVANTGLPMHPRAVRALAKRGIRVTDDWTSRQLTGVMIDSADLVLTAAAEHRATVVASRPSALPNTFTLLQFARLAERIEPLGEPDQEKLGFLYLEAAQSSRHLVRFTPQGRDDIPDPLRRRPRAFKRCADTVADAVAAMTAPLPSR